VAIGVGLWWLGAAGGLGRWHMPTQAMAGSFPARAVNVFFLFGFVYSSFHSVSLLLADIIWVFGWLLARPCLLLLAGLCFIVLRSQNVCSCNVSLLYLIAALS
jgi:hypothetical protein